MSFDNKSLSEDNSVVSQSDDGTTSTTDSNPSQGVSKGKLFTKVVGVGLGVMVLAREAIAQFFDYGGLIELQAQALDFGNLIVRVSYVPPVETWTSTCKNISAGTITVAVQSTDATVFPVTIDGGASASIAAGQTATITASFNGAAPTTSNPESFTAAMQFFVNGSSIPLAEIELEGVITTVRVNDHIADPNPPPIVTQTDPLYFQVPSPYPVVVDTAWEEKYLDRTKDRSKDKDKNDKVNDTCNDHGKPYEDC